MKLFLVCLGLWLSILRVPAQSVGVSLVSFSVQIQPATTRLLGLTYGLTISSSGSSGEANNELAIADDTIPYSHQSYFILTDPTFPDPTVFPFALDIPNQGDADTNGLADFFDVGMGTPGIRTTGVHATPDGNGADFTATWTRSAGQSTGQVVIDLPSLGLTFTHGYTILQYNGQFTYAADTNRMSGTVSLTNLLAGDDQITGPLSLTITNNNQLGYDPGVWTNAVGANYVFHSIDSLDRGGSNYIAALEFDDGYPTTSAPDYGYWFLIIHSADTNGNGVLDFVEIPSQPEQLQPHLDIQRRETEFDITIHGTAGMSYVLQSTETLSRDSNAAWTDAQTIKLTSGAVTIPLPSTSGQKFFRQVVKSPSGGQ